jgi:hypothetical protein
LKRRMLAPDERDLQPRLLGSDWTAIRHAFVALAKRWHPDHNGGSAEAAAVLARIVDLRNIAMAKLVECDGSEPTVLRLDTIDGRAFELKTKRRLAFELGEMAIATAHMAFVLLRAAIEADMADARDSAVTLQAGIGVSCLDQIQGMAEALGSRSPECFAPSAGEDAREFHRGRPGAAGVGPHPEYRSVPAKQACMPHVRADLTSPSEVLA